MKILHVSTYAFGGAAIAALRLHKGLIESGFDSHFLSQFPYEHPIPHSSVFEKKPLRESFFIRFHKKLQRILKEFYIDISPKEKIYLANRPEGLEMFSTLQLVEDLTETKEYEEADLIHLHWVSNFLDYTSFFDINTKPVVWTLHDMNPFTGGCHYDNQCGRFTSECLNCPQLTGTIDPDYSSKILNVKSEAMQNAKRKPHIVAPSHWLLNESKKSRLFKELSHTCIPYGLDINKFKPRDQAFCRDLLGLPAKKKIILFVAHSLSNKRKGLQLLLETYKNLKDVILCAVGMSGESDVPGLFQLGTIQNEEMMSAVYSAADVFVIPSLEDNLPNTALESLCCGTPVIGFSVGGIKEIIEHHQNGLICQELTEQALFDSLCNFLDNPGLFDREKIRTDAIAKYALTLQAKAYIDLYYSLSK